MLFFHLNEFLFPILDNFILFFDFFIDTRPLGEPTGIFDTADGLYNKYYYFSKPVSDVNYVFWDLHAAHMHMLSIAYTEDGEFPEWYYDFYRNIYPDILSWSFAYRGGTHTSLKYGVYLPILAEPFFMFTELVIMFMSRNGSLFYGLYNFYIYFDNYTSFSDFFSCYFYFFSDSSYKEEFGIDRPIFTSIVWFGVYHIFNYDWYFLEAGYHGLKEILRMRDLDFGIFVLPIARHFSIPYSIDMRFSLNISEKLYYMLYESWIPNYDFLNQHKGYVENMVFFVTPLYNDIFWINSEELLNLVRGVPDFANVIIIRCGSWESYVEVSHIVDDLVSKGLIDKKRVVCLNFDWSACNEAFKDVIIDRWGDCCHRPMSVADFWDGSSYYL